MEADEKVQVLQARIAELERSCDRDGGCGYLHMVLGPMFAGKSTSMTKAIMRHKKVVVLVLRLIN